MPSSLGTGSAVSPQGPQSRRRCRSLRDDRIARSWSPQWSACSPTRSLRSCSPRWRTAGRRWPPKAPSLAGVAHRMILGDELEAMFGEERLAALPAQLAHRHQGRRSVLSPTRTLWSGGPRNGPQASEPLSKPSVPRTSSTRCPRPADGSCPSSPGWRPLRAGRGTRWRWGGLSTTADPRGDRCVSTGAVVLRQR